MTHYFKPAPLALLCIALANTFAALPAHADSDTFSVRIGAMHVDGDARFNGQTNGDTGIVGYRSERFDFGGRTGPRIEGVLHFSPRNRVLFNYFHYQRNRQFALDHDVTIGGNRVPAGSSAEARAKFGLGSLIYDYALRETPKLSVGLQIGAAWASAHGRVHSTDGNTISSDHGRESGIAPVLGLRLSTNSANQRWHATVQGQYVNADWGNLDTYGGSITRINALGEYRMTRHFGLYVGYDWFQLKVDHRFGQANGGIDLRFKGPTAGITLAL